jgi:hypothetical protein
MGEEPFSRRGLIDQFADAAGELIGRSQERAFDARAKPGGVSLPDGAWWWLNATAESPTGKWTEPSVSDRRN